MHLPNPKPPASIRGGGWAADHQLARTCVVTLATGIPATSDVDYWEVLQRLDELVGPYGKSPVALARALTRGELYEATRDAIEQLGASGIERSAVRGVVELLDRQWERDPTRDDGDHESARSGGAS